MWTSNTGEDRRWATGGSWVWVSSTLTDTTRNGGGRSRRLAVERWGGRWAVTDTTTVYEDGVHCLVPVTRHGIARRLHTEYVSCPTVVHAAYFLPDALQAAEEVRHLVTGMVPAHVVADWLEAAWPHCPPEVLWAMRGW